MATDDGVRVTGGSWDDGLECVEDELMDLAKLLTLLSSSALLKDNVFVCR